jgi:hypothetical protein
MDRVAYEFRGILMENIADKKKRNRRRRALQAHKKHLLAVLKAYGESLNHAPKKRRSANLLALRKRQEVLRARAEKRS